MPALFLCLLLLAMSFMGTVHVEGAPVCMQRNGVELCAQDKGFIQSAHIFGRSSSLAMEGLYFQMVTIQVRNQTTRSLSISPENFQGETEAGQRYVVDKSLQGSMSWPRKLRAATLHPGDSLEGDLFFPVFFSPVRRIVHNGHPYMETFLY